MAEITAERFFKATGNHPVQDDLERANCLRHAFGVGDHTFCGWCDRHDKPRSQCGACMEEKVAESQANRGGVGK